MAIPQSRTDLKEYCLRKLGKPVINIEVEDSQLEDRLDDSVQKWQEAHYDATVDEWYAHELTQQDIDNNYISLPSEFLVVIEVADMNDITSSSDMFSYQYQVGMHELSYFRPFDQVDYFMKMQNFNQVNDMINSRPSFEFVRHANQLILKQVQVNELPLGSKIGIRVMRLLDPQSTPKLFNDTWLKKYTTALFKLQWGNNTKKFQGVQLLGGVEINGQQMYDEVLQEIEQLELELEEKYTLPIDFIVG